VDPVALCADAAACWHTSWLTSLGLRSERRDAVWRALDAAPYIYWTAITLAPHAPVSGVSDARGTLCDSWSSLDLAPFGFAEWRREPWFVRAPGALPDAETPAELDVVRVSTPAEVAEFERVSARGFGGDESWVKPGAFHPPAILADTRMTMLVGRVRQRPVAAAMSYRADDATGIYGVTTIAQAQGRGYASALTRALIDPTAPAVLSPSPEAERLYRRLGFEQVGELRMWQRA
jgi:hypothetical protein